jgi:hypothetical protein
MATHELKTWPTFFQAVLDGRKNFDVRYDDRGYQAGDTVVLREWDPDKYVLNPLARVDERYTGHRLQAEIGYVLHAVPHALRGIQSVQAGHNLEGYVVFSLLDVKELLDET